MVVSYIAPRPRAALAYRRSRRRISGLDTGRSEACCITSSGEHAAGLECAYFNELINYLFA